MRTILPIASCFALLAVAGLLLPQQAFAGSPNAALANFSKRLHAGEKLTAVTYGTSVTEYGAWVAMVQKWFDEKFPGQVVIVNSGGHGQNSTWGAAQIQPKVLDQKPDLVFIEFAANDAHTRFNLPVEAARKNLDAIVAAILGQNPDAAIILQTMNAFWDCTNAGGFAAADSSRPKLEDYNNNYRACAKERGLALIDNYPDWVRFKKEHCDQFQIFLPDGTHPNKEGVRTVMWPNLEKFLEANFR